MPFWQSKTLSSSGASSTQVFLLIFICCPKMITSDFLCFLYKPLILPLYDSLLLQIHLQRHLPQTLLHLKLLYKHREFLWQVSFNCCFWGSSGLIYTLCYLCCRASKSTSSASDTGAAKYGLYKIFILVFCWNKWLWNWWTWWSRFENNLWSVTLKKEWRWEDALSSFSHSKNCLHLI